MTTISIQPVGEVIPIGNDLLSPTSTAALQDYSFELDGYAFGPNREVILDGADAFDPGVETIRSQDSELAQEDGLAFGRDLISPPTWSWKLCTDRSTAAEALLSLQRIKSAWRAEEIRRTPGAVSVLRYAVGGRTRRVYGRARRFAAPPENRIMGGYVPITADFQCADHLHYDDALSSQSVVIEAAIRGNGFVFPLEFPMMTLLVEGSRAGGLWVGGSAPTWAMVTFTGPVIAPSLTLNNGFTIGLRGAIEAGQSVTIDPRPWARTVTANDGTNYAGDLTRKSRLGAMRLAPGSHSFVYRGVDFTGTSRCTVAWRNASHSL